MLNFLQKQAFKLRPDLKELSGIQLTSQILNVYIVLFNIPLMFIGTAWLVLETDFSVFQDFWPLLLVLLGIAALFSRFRFELQLELRPGVLMSSGGTLRFIVVYSAIFIFGPTAIWLGILDSILNAILSLRNNPDIRARWTTYAQTILSLAPTVISLLASLKIYILLGGSYPLPDLSLKTIGAAAAFLIIDWILPFIILLPILIYLFRSPDLAGEGESDPKSTLFFIILSSAIPNLALPFTVLGAALYTLTGPGLYIFFLLGALLANILASKLTDNVQQRTQRARELAALEKLGRLIIEAPPDTSTLPQILADQIPPMFYGLNVYIWLNPDSLLYETSQEPFTEIEAVKELVANGEDNYYLITSKNAPLEKNQSGLAVPIKNEAGNMLGAVYGRADDDNTQEYLPALQALAAQIASALFRADMYQETLKKERMTKELELAGRIQADFLPEVTPEIPGYQIAASLTPALQTSGDFYDFIHLPDGKLGILVADVADKGTGAALFGALTRTLIRTYAFEHPNQPELVLKYANERVMSDTQAQLFVTTFYAVIDPQANTMAYVNGGHNPTYLFSPKTPDKVQALIRTGIPIGIMDDAEWESDSIDIKPDDVIVFYTDGVTEAQKADGILFDDDGLQKAIQECLESSAQDIHDAVIHTIKDFIQDSPQFDDLTLVVVKREVSGI